MAVKKTGAKVIDGVAFRSTTPDIICMLWMFLNAPRLDKDPEWRQEGMLPNQGAYCGTGRHKYSRLITEAQRPGFQWHDWAIKADMAFCEYNHTAVSGGAGSSKSFTAGDYAFKFWQCAPNDTSVVIVSTSVEAAKKRIWKSIAQAFMEASRNLRGLGANLGTAAIINSPRPYIRTKRGDFINGIYVVPIEEGNVDKAVDAIKGYHNTRVLIVRDEADAVSPAALEVESNLRVGTEEFRSIDLGNLPSTMNPLGKQMAIGEGKPITEAMGVEWISARGIKCLRFDGENSPNIRDNGKWSGLINEIDRAAIEKSSGGKNTRAYFVMVKGLPPPEGVDDTVVSEPLLHAHKAFDKVTWKSGFTLFAALDPGFGGDKCCYRTFKRGQDTENQERIFLDEVLTIPITTGDPTNPPEYQIAEKVKNLCASRGIPPNEFIADTTGIGSGVAATLQREWSPSINTCEFGGAPSDMIVSEEDRGNEKQAPRPAKEVYDRRVTELWFSIREFIQANMIRGMDETTAIQLCQRKWDYKAKKKAIQKKDELPSSPNEADALACAIELLRRKGINASVQTQAKSEANHNLIKEAQEQDFDSGPTYEEPTEEDYAQVGVEYDWD